ncbi:DUF3373 domain-containing protein [Geotalea sp. SG265]|uniref:DUF3373 domain-containing protein n=1 Tax=Geotalea sp. SG265 TaxID=2922867 RepID=UPI001FAF671C|nr:DUF3373 domain-containing protein [Geotalea sp. SG265]
MKAMWKRTLLSSLLLALALPMSAMAADQDLQQRVDALTKELDALKQQVNKTERKSLGNWLTIGGDYRFRVDSIRGETAAYTNAATFMGAAQQDPKTQGFFSTALAQGLFSATSYGQVAGLTPNAMMGNLVTYLTAPGMPYAGDPAGAAAYLTSLGGKAFVPSYKPKNDTLYTNRLGLDLHAKATKDVTVNVRLLAYKTFGSQDDSAVTNGGSSPFFADRVGVFDGTLGHIPSTSLLDVDRAYATWSNIADEPIWFSVGRRPSTNGAPSNLRMNNERPGNGGTPALLVDYAFDGFTLGYAPDIDALSGAYAKICYGRAFDSGFSSPTNSLRDTDMLGVAVIPYDTDALRIWTQWNHAFNIFDFPVMNNTAFGNTHVKADLGAIDWYGIGAMSTLKNVGPGNVNFFGDFGYNVIKPNNNVSAQAGFQGLMTGGFLAPEAPHQKDGWATYVGARYDFAPTATKVGFEFNHGSKNWMPFDPAADDILTSKLGTRGNVYEGYLIQELKLQPISSYLSKVFFRLGYQYYDFEYTGSNNWVGAPVKIADIKPDAMMLLTPVKKAQNVYATFEVKF